MRLIELEKKLKEGTSYDVSVFSPGIMAAVNSRVKVGAKQDVDLLGRIVPLTKVETVMSMPGTGEIVSTGYVDEQLRRVKKHNADGGDERGNAGLREGICDEQQPAR